MIDESGNKWKKKTILVLGTNDSVLKQDGRVQLAIDKKEEAGFQTMFTDASLR